MSDDARPAATPRPTLMAAETLEIPARAERQRAGHGRAYAAAGDALRELDPAFVATLGRGSSAHAARWLGALVELGAGVPAAPLSMATASVYARPLRLRGAACIGVSQSGRSEDFLAAMRAARAGGALCLAATNDPDAPALDDGVVGLPIAAGPERAVSATKSFTGSLIAAASTVAAWTGDDELERALDALAPVLARALELDWAAMAEPLGAASSVYTIGRGPSLGIAREAALKLKETCGIHAEPWSAAELLHGPLQLAAGSLAALVFASDDESRDGVRTAVDRLEAAGATVVVADPCERPGDELGGAVRLPVARSAHRWLDGVSQIASFYRAVEAMSRARGMDPDRPSLLAKVTRTR